MEIKTVYTFTDNEIEEAVYKAESYQRLSPTDIKTLVYGCQQWLNFKNECRKDPSYQWGYGHTYY